MTGLGVDGQKWRADCNMALTNAGTGIDSACSAYACQVTGSCRLPSHGDAPGDCGSIQSWAATSVGLAASSLTPEQRAGNADCSTLEDRAIDDARLAMSVSRTSSSDAFWANLPAPDAQEVAARSRLTSEAKLMFELGITSSSVSPTAIQTLYDAAPADEMSCGVSAQLPLSAECATWAHDRGVTGQVGMCQRMLSSHVASVVFDAQLQPCLDLIGMPMLLGDATCAVALRDNIETLEEQLLQKSLTQASGDETIRSALANIDRWYTSAARTYYEKPKLLTDATSRVLNAFWTRMYGTGAPIPAFATGSDGTETAKQQLSLFQDARLAVDRQVLSAAFGDPAPLDDVPLLLIVGDALTQLTDRLRVAAPMYDVACRITGDCTATAANEATQIVRLVGSIGDDGALGAALSAATGVRQEWRDVFTALRARRSALQAALRKATGRPSADLSELYLPSSVAPAAALAERVSNSLAMWNSYVAHGVLLPRDNTVLRTSLVDSKVGQTLQNFSDDRGVLGSKRGEYQQNRGAAAKTIVDLIDLQQFETQVQNEMASSLVDYNNLARDLDGLTQSQDHAEQEIGKFLATYIERARSPGWLTEYPVQGTPVSLRVDATQARGSGGIATDVPTVAVHGPSGAVWKVDVTSGDQLTFDVSNTWSPTCALRTTTLVGPGTSISKFQDPTHLLVGPEGFSVEWQGTTYHASDHTTADVTSQTDSKSICGSISGNLLTAVSGNIPVGNLALSGSMCRQWQTGHVDTDSTSDGSRFQYAASFAGGMRIPGTPFPTLPGGALLLVEVIDGTDGLGHIRDVHVVRSHATFMFPETAHVYLVDNDKHCDDVDPSQLAVTYTLAKSSKAASLTLAQTMAQVLGWLDAQKALYVAQGLVTASELSSLQSSAYDQLRTACQCDLSAYPDEVRGMFDAWLGAELASIERATRLAAAERQLDSLVLRLEAYNDDLASAQSKARLLALLTQWSLSQLGHTILGTYVDSVLEDINGNVMPIMQVLYPQALVKVRQLAQMPLTSLRGFDWMLPYDEQAMLLETVSDVIRSQVQQARSVGGQSVAPLVVVFPKPGAAAPAVAGAVIAPTERLDAVWQPCTQGYCLRQTPTFSISPEDVYGHPLVGLGCGEAAPVVQTFALIAANAGSTANDSWNVNQRRGDIARASDMVFPTETGLLGFRTDGVTSVLTPSRVRVLASSEVATGSTFDQYIRHGVDVDQQGVSPFDGFTVDLGPVTGAPLSATTAMVVYFDVQTRVATGPLKGIGVCAEPLAPQGEAAR